MKVVIVGGVAGGASAAARIRRLDEDAQVIMIERSGYVSYANCGLPYYVGGVIEDQEELTLQTPESFWRRFRIDVRVRQEVTAIDTEKKSVTVHALDSGESYTETYDKLLLAPGAKPTVPTHFGADIEHVFTLRTVEDTLCIHRFVAEHKPKTAVLAGGGFIALEMAENLVKMGVSVTIVQRQKQLLTTLDADMASFVHAQMRTHGIKLRLGVTVEEFCQDGDSVRTLLDGGESLTSDMVLLAIGVTPDTHLAKDAGIKLGVRDSIAVNERMETSIPDIYAVGDAVEIRHFVTGQKTLISLAGPANKQGRIAADNICGGNSHFAGSQGSAVLKLFKMTAASTGINEKTAQVMGINYDKVVLFPASHASYYPGAHSIAMKVLYEKESKKLLGAQIVGSDGVDKRIDVLATAIRAGMTALDLTELDLAYAPPYSSAKDPVNMAGFMIENLESGKVKQFHWNDVEGLPHDGSAVLLDVRNVGEYQRGHLDDFKNIPLQYQLPQFVVANAVVHMDEDSPHMHVVGVPVGTGYKKGMSKQVSKRKVFTKDVLSIVLQDKLRAFANEKVKIVLGEQIREKSKGRNHDLSVMEYKVLKEEIRYDELKEQADEKQQENELLEREKKQLVQEYDTLSMRVAVKQMDYEEAAERVKEANERAGRIEAYIKTQSDTLVDLEDKATKLERKAEIAEMVYDMARGFGGNETLRDKLIDVMYENEQLKAENSKLRETLNKAYDFMKQFVVDGRNLLERFLESIGQVVEKVRSGLKR